ncbi:MAG: MFS transporter [Chloroflexi bacterium]|nr:MFS transporter [Chloroflexota bacterium]
MATASQSPASGDPSQNGQPEYPERILGAPTRGRVFFGWYIVGAGSIIQFLVGALMNQAFGGYAAALSREFGWSRSLISGAFAMSRVESGLLGPMQGWMIDRFGPMAIMRLGLVIFSVGFILFSLMQNVWQFYLFFFLMAVGASLGGFLSITVAVVNWFDRARSRALGISQLGFAIGGIAASGVILAITQVGWRETAFVSGILVAVIGLPLTAFMVRRPEEIGLEVDGMNQGQRDTARASDLARNRQSNSTEVDFTARQAMRTLSFWTISLGHSSALFVVGAVMVHLFLHLTESFGYSDERAAFFIGLMTVFQIVGQVGGASLGDFVSKRLIVIICMMMHAIGLLLLAYINATWAVVAFCVLNGTAWGTRGPLMQAIRADYFGRSSFGTIMGFSSLIIMIGTTAGPLIAGFLYDRTGSYELAFTIIAAIAAAGAIFFLISYRPAPPSLPPSPTTPLPDTHGPAV